jgi:hypothetical protein
MSHKQEKQGKKLNNRRTRRRRRRRCGKTDMNGYLCWAIHIKWKRIRKGKMDL